MKKRYIPVLSAALFSALPANAVCPVCVVAVGAGLGLSQYLGIDDTIAGVWVGGLLAAISFWTIDWFNKKNWLNTYRSIRNLLIFLAYYGLTIWPLWTQGLVGHPINRLWGADKLLLGIVIGSLVLWGASELYEYMKKKNGQPHFPYEKVVLPFGSLIVFSLVFYIITK